VASSDVEWLRQLEDDVRSGKRRADESVCLAARRCHHGCRHGRAREALALWAEDADTAELEEEIRLPAPARAAIRESKTARHAADRQPRSAQAATAWAAQLLVEELDLGLRDAGELLDLSYQRVQQLVSSTVRPQNS